MKKTILLITLIFTTLVFAQKPKADVIRFDPQTSAPLNPQRGWVYYSSLDDGIYKYDGTSWIQIGSGSSGSSLIITDGTNTINDVTNINFTGATVSGTTPNGVITISGGGGGSSTGLERLTEVGNSGFRIIGRDPLNYGDIGAEALDFSISNSPSNTKGATGVGSVAFGTSDSPGLLSFAANGDNNSSGDYSASFNSDTDSGGYASFSAGEVTSSPSYVEFSIGSYSIPYTPASTTSVSGTDRLFNAGNGTSSVASNAFTIFKNGSIVLYPVSKASITNAQAGMMIFDSDESNKLKFYDGTNWREITTTID
ncbi:hypothetical protein [Aquimarina sp. AU119]|uniref:hypothetical protein n=1 Tax=Aquimarina sp. AU119 TaxID=2108528 RepID=UPI000D69A00F|nr:hypothetical protein [Aquimarina sp. AU119]